MNKLIITKWQGRVLTALYAGDDICQLNLEDGTERPLLNNIYIGKVKNVIKNINSAFVDIGDGHTAYYNLGENPRHLYTKPHGGGPIRPGDEIIVQVIKDAVKSKDPVISSCLNFTGRLSVLTAGKTVIGFSNKITDQAWKQTLKEKVELEMEEGFGIIIRTNAYEAESEDILNEIRQLKETYRQVLETGSYRTAFSLLYEAVPSYIGSLRDAYEGSVDEILTDDPGIYDTLKTYLETQQEEDLRKLSYYNDPMVSLLKLYRLEKALDEALGRRVWLKSGGYLVIEPTEALTVVDVNTGKYAGRKNPRDTIMKINLEAAEETARQLRLRNLSGIIIIDFIDMTDEEDRLTLVNSLSQWCRNDPVKTTVVDITKLNLVEVTRKKLRRPLHEIIGKSPSLRSADSMVSPPPGGRRTV